VGPVDDAGLLALRAQGKVLEETLVWREGMADWQPYLKAVAVPAGARQALATPGVGEAVCAECGKTFPDQDMIGYGNAHVCAQCKPVFLQKLAEGAKLSGAGLDYAGFWIRAGAKILDGLLLGVLFAVPLIVVVIRRTGATAPNEMLGAIQLLQVGMGITNLAYQIFFLGKYGATPGKMACGLKVVMADGSPISYGRAAGRFFAEMLSGIICYIGYLMVAFDEEKRALHDRICNTRVVRK